MINCRRFFAGLVGMALLCAPGFAGFTAIEDTSSGSEIDLCAALDLVAPLGGGSSWCPTANLNAGAGGRRVDDDFDQVWQDGTVIVSMTALFWGGSASPLDTLGQEFVYDDEALDGTVEKRPSPPIDGFSASASYTKAVGAHAILGDESANKPTAWSLPVLNTPFPGTSITDRMVTFDVSGLDIYAWDGTSYQFLTTAGPVAHIIAFDPGSDQDYQDMLILVEMKTPGPACTFDSNCDDGKECTVDTCNTVGGCVHAKAALGMTCELDGNRCTTDQCDGAGLCAFLETVVCPDNGVGCDGPETCNPATGACESSPDLCDPATERCCEDTDTCVPADGCCADSECDNSTPCIQTETCDPQGACQLVTEIRDCNVNGIEDLCDIAEGSSQDCDGSLVPDECEADCNGNGLHDSCDLAAGTSEDCNGNGIPDECDIADCAGDPACDDCNLNGVPDGCDIDFGGWPDVDPEDGIPDACVDPDDIGGDWTDDIWDLADEDPENPYPDNRDGVGNLHVTVDGFTVFVDETIEIQTLRLLNGGTLLVTQCEFGDFSTAAVGGILNEGNLLVGGDRHIDVAGSDLTIGPGGRYEATPSTCATICPSGAVCASLTARDLLLTAGDCASLRSGGDVVIDQSMSVELSGDLVLLGNPFFGCEAGRGAQPRGINVFPKFRAIGSALASVRDVVLEGASSSSNRATTVAASGDVGGASGISAFGIRMRGDFVNHSIAPSLFDWVTGYLTAAGTEQLFEVAGIDIGPSEEGFLTARATLFDSGPHTNFAIGTLDVRPGSHLTFVNDFANTVGDGPCEEAFYVKRLILHEGATLTLNNINVYYESLEDGGGVIETLGCGALQGLCNAQIPETDSTAKNRFISITTGIPGRQQAIRVILDDLPAPFDTLNGQAMWVGEPTAINESASTVAPEPGGKSFWASQLQCAPYFADWSTVGTVQVYHQAVVPGGSYPIQIVDESCTAGSEVDFSAPLDMSMAGFGDVVGTCSTESCSPPNGVVDILDLFAVINAFASTPGAVSKVRADIDPAVPDFIINITDALVAVDAFAGVPFPFLPPENPCGNR